ncbi:hypothetical protein Tsubulata_025138 [Turnera subulata]|uniref:PLAC8 family protein n=1 Tax=Turnera subulata TaxID=218843 RepID=A0A9Q0FE82_9ROSI|nr:hypothetical protein Tsubulata_025138 [Turnera subulata]
MEKIGDLEKQVIIVGGKEEEMEEEVEDMSMSVLDFDLLCSTVALQTQGKWTRLEADHGGEKDGLLGDNGNNGGGGGGGVFRMWEGELLDFCDDRRVALESFCCPCYRFGKNMRRAGFGYCFLQGIVHYILALSALLNFVAFVVTKSHCFLYLAVAFTISVGMYLGFFRTRMRNKFNIRGRDSYLDDCLYHVFCPCCTLSQESRTLEMNNVQDGTWHGRGDTICIGGYSEGNKAFFELHPPPVVSI